MIATVKKIAPGVSLEGESPDFVAGAFAVAISMALDVDEPEPSADEPADAGPAPAPAGAAAEARADALDARRKSRRSDVDDINAPSSEEVARQKMLDRRVSAGRKD